MTDISSSTADLAAAPANNARYYFLMAAVVVGLAIVMLTSSASIDGGLNPLFQEGGFVEGLSPIGYVFCIVLIIAQGGFRFASTRALALIVVLIALTLRELDFHVRFTVMSLEKLKFYWSPEVPLVQKAIGLVVLIALAAAVIHLIRKHGTAFLSGLRIGDPVSVATLFDIGSIGLSKSIDGINHRLADMGFSMGAQSAHVFEMIEETTELGISLFAIIAIIAYFGSARDFGEKVR